ncbi:MAG: transcriptional regulator [Idiomarina sp.]|nr:transcriptional regulator [Idiomarina sp.]
MMHDQLDPIIHPPKRLQICALLVGVTEMDFSTLRETLDVSDSVLSKQLKYLEDADYVAARKVLQDGRQRTWLTLTKQGRAAFAAHVQALRAIADIA